MRRYIHEKVYSGSLTGELHNVLYLVLVGFMFIQERNFVVDMTVNCETSCTTKLVHT